MAESFEPGILRAIWYTPLRDAVRWRWSARLDWRRSIALAALPAEIKTLIGNIVQPAWLLRSEKADIAAELVDHFALGMAAGQSAQMLIQQFGDVRQARRLISYSKRRGRPTLLKCLLFVPAALIWTTALAAAFYLIISAIFFLGQPTIRIDYVALVNASIRRTPTRQTAWPVYRRAMLEMGNVPSEIDPDQTHWTQWLNHLKNKPHIIELLRAAASKPALGFTFGFSGSEYDAQLWPPGSQRWKQSLAAEPLIWSTFLPQMSRFWQLARILQSDLQNARANSDESRFMLDVRAFLSMANQLQDAPLADSLWSSMVRSAAMDSIERALTDQPALLSDADLQYISRQLSGPRVAADIIHLDAEHFFVLDSLQRMYTDNGHGDGRITPAGFEYLKCLNVWTHPKVADRLTRPISLLISPSRKEVLDEYKAMMQLARQNLELPAREADWRQYNQQLQLFWSARPQDAGRQFLAAALPDMQPRQTTAERYLGSRDGLLVAIALERYHRVYGQYPATLSELIPNFLSEIPADRITGTAIKYKLVSGLPLLYSVGEDRIDDGGIPGTQHGTPILDAGVPYKSHPGQMIPGDFVSPYACAEWNINPQNAKPGDWILFPR